VPLDRVARHPAGDRPQRDLLRMRLLELTLHGWDLARSLDLDETPDAAPAGHLLKNCMYLVEELRDHGHYARAGDADLVSPQGELLRRTGAPGSRRRSEQRKAADVRSQRKAVGRRSGDPRSMYGRSCREPGWS